jgi:hypothetical protein
MTRETEATGDPPAQEAVAAGAARAVRGRG